jgi:hypothetical protein
MLMIYSIIAVHSLDAHPNSTWVKRIPESPTGSAQVDVNWLRDLLPKVVPNTRIASFGYKSQWFGDGAIDTNVFLIADKLLYALKEWRKVILFGSTITESLN